MSSTGQRTFVVAVRRERRSEVPSDWVDTVRGIAGVSVETPVANPVRIVVRATAQAADQIRSVLRDLVLVEEHIPHATA